MTVLGLPLFIWGIGCLVVATIYFIFWTRPRSGGRFTSIVLRWFHGAVWVLLAASCFIAPLSFLGGTTTATVAALLAFACYLVFVVVLFRDRLAKTATQRPAGEGERGAHGR